MINSMGSIHWTFRVLTNEDVTRYYMISRTKHGKVSLWLDVEFAQYRSTKMVRMEAPTSQKNPKRFNCKTTSRCHIELYALHRWNHQREQYRYLVTTHMRSLREGNISVVSVSVSTGRVPCGKSPVQTCSFEDPPCPDLSPTLQICWHADGWPSTEMPSCLLLPAVVLMYFSIYMLRQCLYSSIDVSVRKQR